MIEQRPAVGELQGFIFDLDGVLYRGNEVVPGAPEFVARLRRAGIPHLFLTNNATTPPAAVAARLSGMGIRADQGDVLTSAQATALMLRRDAPGATIYLIGEEGIRGALLEAGFELTGDHARADVVVVSMDRSVTYDKLRDATLAIRRGARFVATNADRTLPTEIGLIPGAGSIAGLIELASDVRPTVVGKPSVGIFETALKRLGTPRELTAAIGDRPETDIAGGSAAGLRTIGVLTGVGTRAAFGALPTPPEWVFASLRELERAYFGE